MTRKDYLELWDICFCELPVDTKKVPPMKSCRDIGNVPEKSTSKGWWTARGLALLRLTIWKPRHPILPNGLLPLELNWFLLGLKIWDWLAQKERAAPPKIQIEPEINDGLKVILLFQGCILGFHVNLPIFQGVGLRFITSYRLIFVHPSPKDIT